MVFLKKLRFLDTTQFMTRKPTRTLEDQRKIVHMNFETTKELRNAFKSKVAINGKSAREVLEELMKEYIKK